MQSDKHKPGRHLGLRRLWLLGPVTAAMLKTVCHCLATVSGVEKFLGHIYLACNKMAEDAVHFSLMQGNKLVLQCLLF